MKSIASVELPRSFELDRERRAALVALGVRTCFAVTCWYGGGGPAKAHRITVAVNDAAPAGVSAAWRCAASTARSSSATPPRQPSARVAAAAGDAELDGDADAAGDGGEAGWTTVRPRTANTATATATSATAANSATSTHAQRGSPLRGPESGGDVWIVVAIRTFP